MGAVLEPRLSDEVHSETKITRRYLSQSEYCNVAGADYKLVKSIISPFRGWHKFIVRPSTVPIYSAIVVAGGWGCGLVIWIPNKGFFIHELELPVADEQLVEGQKNYSINDQEFSDLTLEFLMLIRFKKPGLYESFERDYEVFVLHSILELMQPAIYQNALQDRANGLYDKFITFFNNLDYQEECYFCGKASYTRTKEGLVYELCRCRETYLYSRTMHLILMHHAVHPKHFQETTKIKQTEEGEVEKIKYLYSLGNHKFVVKIGLSKKKVDDHDFGTWTRGQYLTLEEARVKAEVRQILKSGLSEEQD